MQSPDRSFLVFLCDFLKISFCATDLVFAFQVTYIDYICTLFSYYVLIVEKLQICNSGRLAHVTKSCKSATLVIKELIRRRGKG